MKTVRAFAVLMTLPFILALVGCSDDEWDNPFGKVTHLVVANNTATDVYVEIDQHQNGSIRILGTVPAFSQRKWEVDTGWAWLYVDDDAIEIYLDDDHDGFFEIREE